MCVARCSRCVGMSLVPMAILSMVANALLLFPNLKVHYLLEGHVTREALWGTGLWASGFLILLAARGFVSSSTQMGCCGFRTEMLCQFGYSCVALAAAGICFLVSGTGLAQGPLCLHNSTQGLNWEVPLSRQMTRDRNYLFERERWATACVEPQGVVLWNVVLFSVLMATSGIQVLLCAAHTLNALLGVLCGPGFRNNKVGPV
ncbi:transmembrane 4 L6 family member 1 [Megalops cyprinoides]|uniref:transmembrane 4 L6 family member 1 n=1 Tax=Megalops cyprinoides TaxID=118141 RepID=UPI0018653C71|nr:transmembrane 4 L6 family member 1 [Megalops cyprinoides]